MQLSDANRPESIVHAAELLRAGQIIAYPTETVYGLGVDPFNEAALTRLFAAKGRAREQAILLVVGNRHQLDRVSKSISVQAQAYMEAFWPGPLSLLLPKHPDLPEALAPGLKKICVRCPGSTVARKLCEAFGGPVTSTSANASGEPPVESLEDLRLEGIALGLDGGRLPQSPPSTILDVESGEILRAGAVFREQIEVVRKLHLSA